MKQYVSTYQKSASFKEARKDYMQRISNVRLYSKRARLEELQKLYSDAYERYNISQSKPNTDSLLKLLNQARLEEDGHVKNQITINNTTNVQNNVTNILNKSAQEYITKTLPLREIIISRVCLKSGYDTVKFMERLHNSHYAAQSGMRGGNQIMEKVSYPSQIIMDLNDVAEKARSGEQTKVVDYEEIEAARDESVNEAFSAMKEDLINQASVKREKADNNESDED
tara:strand:- start:100 stop:777 length:678 start_codon:yes stop_codon:yes gene_type:complete